jgi:DNA-binding GntR family transcriptional regulator
MTQQRDRQTAHEFVRETLRSQILSGELYAGTRLVQSEVAQQLQVSTTPVREALRDLATEGLIKLDAHRGAVVHRTSRDELEEVFRLRRLLEPEAVRRALSRLSDADIAEAEAIQSAADSEEDPRTWSDLNRQFHSVFTRAADSPRLASMIASLQDAASIYVVTSIIHGRDHHHPGHHYHWELLEAARARDADKAAQVMESHIDETLEALIGSRSPASQEGQ